MSRTRLPAKSSPFKAAAPILGAHITIGAENTNIIKATVQLKNANGSNLDVRGKVFAYLSADAHGDAIVGSAPNGGWAIAANGLLLPVVTNKAAHLVSEANGLIDVNITDSGTPTMYLIVVLPDGTLVPSTAITFA